MNDITFFQPHSRVHCTNSRNPYTSRKDGFTTVGFFFDLGKTASGQWGTKFFQEKQPLKNILAVLKLTKSNTNLFNRKITIMKVKVSNYAPKAFLSDTQQIWHKKCLIKLIILAKAREMLLSTRIWKQTNWYITIAISLVSTRLHRNKFTRQSQYKHIHTSIHESIHTKANTFT